MSNYLKPAEVAERMELHGNTIRKWRQRGYGPPFVTLPNGHHVYPRNAFEQWFNENMQVSA